MTGTLFFGGGTKMKYVVTAFTDEAADDLKNQIAACKRNGISHIEIRGVNGKNIGSVTPQEAREIKKLLDGEGIKISAIGSPYGKIGIADDFKPHLEAYKRTIEVAHVLEANKIRIFSFYIPSGKTRSDFRHDVIERVGAFVKFSDGVLPCHENESGIYGEDAEHCLELANAYGGKLKLIFDPANFIFCGVKSRPAYELLKEHIDYFHIKDCESGERKTVPAGFGDGEIKWILKDFKPKENVFLSVEPHLASFTGLSALSKNEEKPLQFAYSSRDEAFDAAVAALKKIMKGL